MSIEIKNLIALNKERRKTYIKEKHSEAFQTALTKVQNLLKRYDPSQEQLKVDICEQNTIASRDLCNEVITHLKAQGIECSYQYVPSWSDRTDYSPEYHYIVFKF